MKVGTVIDVTQYRQGMVSSSGSSGSSGSPTYTTTPTTITKPSNNIGSNSQETYKADNGKMHVAGFFTDRPTLSEHRDHVLNQLNYDLLEYKRSIGLVDDGGTPHLTDAEVEYNKEISEIIVYGNVGMLGGAALGAVGKLVSPIVGKIGSLFGRGTGKTWTSADKYVGETANAIEAKYPGKVADVNKIAYRPDGTILTDFDILLDNTVIQVKAGTAKGLTSQITKTATGTSKEVIGYAPDLNPSSALVKNASKQGIKVFTSLEDLLNYLNK